MSTERYGRYSPANLARDWTLMGQTGAGMSAGVGIGYGPSSYMSPLGRSQSYDEFLHAETDTEDTPCMPQYRPPSASLYEEGGRYLQTPPYDADPSTQYPPPPYSEKPLPSPMSSASGASGSGGPFKCRQLPCRTFISTGSCPYGDRCVFLHDPSVASKPVYIKAKVGA
ncbi:zinc finger CCCH domain-containing protein [archaeon]|nr:MAG: zinc finger CCCH domain-containing protein [archaeon]